MRTEIRLVTGSYMSLLPTEVTELGLQDLHRWEVNSGSTGTETDLVNVVPVRSFPIRGVAPAKPA